MSPSYKPIEIRLTRSQGEYEGFLRKLARGDFRKDWEEQGPEYVLREHGGIEISPSEAIPSTYPELDEAVVTSAIDNMVESPEPLWPYNGMSPFYVFAGLLAASEEAGESEHG